MSAASRAIGRPWLLVNMAMTADGKIATANRRSSSFGSGADKEHLLKLRSTADAVMAGARTVDFGPVNMGPGPARFRRMRLRNGLAEYNLRVVVSGSGSVNPSARIFQYRFSPVILLTTRRISNSARRSLEEAGAQIQICGEESIQWEDALKWLLEVWGVKRLLCEGGGDLNDELFRKALVDELYLTICPLAFGGRAAPTISGGKGVANLAQATAMKLTRMRRVGSELFLRFVAAASSAVLPAIEHLPSKV